MSGTRQQPVGVQDAAENFGGGENYLPAQEKTPTRCKRCNNEGWICENHPNIGFSDKTCCEGAGVQCQDCNAPKGIAPLPRRPWRVEVTGSRINRVEKNPHLRDSAESER